MQKAAKGLHQIEASDKGRKEGIHQLQKEDPVSGAQGKDGQIHETDEG